jgi:uncharacterized membrane protein YphA (DoxX/SURF4 family)
VRVRRFQGFVSYNVAMDVRRYGLWLLLLRLYAGLFWLSHGWQKLTNPGWAAPGGMMAAFVSKMVADTHGAYHDFVTGTVLPNVAIFAHLVAWGETLTGISLLLGLLTPVGAIGGVFLALNYASAKGFKLDALFGTDALAIAISFLCLVLPVGKVAGLDAILFRSRAAGLAGRPPAR